MSVTDRPPVLDAAASPSRSIRPFRVETPSRLRLSLPGGPAVPAAAFLLSRAVVLAAAGVVAVVAHRPVATALSAYDGRWYLELASHGYPDRVLHVQSTLGFFPMYPLVLRGLAFAVRSELLAALVVSFAGGLVATILVQRLATVWWGERLGRRAAVVFALFPGSIVFSMAYSEGLTIPLVVGCLLALRRSRWVLAGVLAGLAAIVEPAALVAPFVCAVVAVRATASARGWSFGRLRRLRSLRLDRRLRLGRLDRRLRLGRLVRRLRLGRLESEGSPGRRGSAGSPGSPGSPGRPGPVRAPGSPRPLVPLGATSVAFRDGSSVAERSSVARYPSATLDGARGGARPRSAAAHGARPPSAALHGARPASAALHGARPPSAIRHSSIARGGARPPSAALHPSAASSFAPLLAPLFACLGVAAFASFLWAWTGSPLAAWVAQHDGWHNQAVPLGVLGIPLVRHLMAHPSQVLHYLGLWNLWNGVLGAAFLVWSLVRLWPARSELSAGALAWVLGVGLVTLWSVKTLPNARMLLVAFPAVLVWARRPVRHFGAFLVVESGLFVFMSVLTLSGHMLP